MIIHKSLDGKKTSASVDDELFHYAVKFWGGDENLVRQNMGELIEEAHDLGLSPSKYIRSVIYQWIVKKELLDEQLGLKFGDHKNGKKRKVKH